MNGKRCYNRGRARNVRFGSRGQLVLADSNSARFESIGWGSFSFIVIKMRPRVPSNSDGRVYSPGPGVLKGCGWRHRPAISDPGMFFDGRDEPSISSAYCCGPGPSGGFGAFRGEPKEHVPDVVFCRASRIVEIVKLFGAYTPGPGEALFRVSAFVVSGRNPNVTGLSAHLGLTS